MGQKRDLTGQRFGRLLVIKETSDRKHGHVVWECKCDCGNIVNVDAGSLCSGNTQSCRCYKDDVAAKSCVSRRKYDVQSKRLYHIWKGMKSRCYNKKSGIYSRYGARGITVCDDWKNDFKSFQDWAFSNGYRDDLTIDRINVNGNYCPENCRWATIKEQSNNTRRSVFLTFNGETHTIAEWSEIIGVPKCVVYSRMYRGRPIEDILSKETLRKKKSK